MVCRQESGVNSAPVQPVCRREAFSSGRLGAEDAGLQVLADEVARLQGFAFPDQRQKVVFHNVSYFGSCAANSRRRRAARVIFGVPHLAANSLRVSMQSGSKLRRSSCR